MIVLDASVLIAFLDSTDVHHARAKNVLLASAGELLAASVVTLAEVLVGPVRTGRAPQVEAAISGLSIEAVPVTLIPLELAELRARTGLRMPDTCVLHTALSRSGAVASFDGQLVAAAESHGLLTVPG